MRVTTDIWVSALVRRVFAEGGFATVLRKGATEAGAIFVVVRDRFGAAELYGPAPQASYDSSRPDDRRFILVGSGEHDAVNARIEKEKRFDPDFWVIELEPGAQSAADLIAIEPGPA